ncbi:MAG: ABC transporter permease subunit [Anaerolineae bacterium]|nr:ABC transporter permease subunit [Anaerolineae bacterium]
MMWGSRRGSGRFPNEAIRMNNRPNSVMRLVRRPDLKLGSAVSDLLRLLGLGLLDVFALWFLSQLWYDAAWELFAVIAVITLAINVIFLRENLYPIRWLTPGLALMMLLVIYPILFAVYISFTNYSGVNLLTERQAIEVLEKERFISGETGAYAWTAYEAPEGGAYLLWLVGPDGQPQVAGTNSPLRPATPAEAAEAQSSADGLPAELGGYTRLNRVKTVTRISELTKLEFGEGPDTIQIVSMDKAGRFQQKYVYDASTDTMTDQETGLRYENREGTFVTADGAHTLSPSFRAFVGARNFNRLVEQLSFDGPIIRIFAWTVFFTVSAVVVQFCMGMFLAIVFNDPIIHPVLRRILRSVLLLPYIVPAYLSILVWQGMLDRHTGIINKVLNDTLGWAPLWFDDPFWAKVAVLMVTFWFGAPYFMLITTGALQAISSEILDAASVDGASGWQRFTNILYPLILSHIKPLLILSFAFNFNNFNNIFLLTGGGPPMSNMGGPAGHTDLLITYTYKISFLFGRGADYAFSAVITIFIYLIMLPLILIQFRYALRAREE